MNTHCHYRHGRGNSGGSLMQHSFAWKQFSIAPEIRCWMQQLRKPRLFASLIHCIAPAETLHVAHAATLGWCMSWYGYDRPASIFHSYPHPAFGLTAGLLISQIVSSIRPSQWRLQIDKWLRNDLDKSWRVGGEFAIRESSASGPCRAVLLMVVEMVGFALCATTSSWPSTCWSPAGSSSAQVVHAPSPQSPYFSNISC